MADYQGILHGAVQFPLPPMGSGLGGVGGSLLRDADPALFYALEFFASVVKTHVEARFMAEAIACSADGSFPNGLVGEILPLNPEPFLTEEQLTFPLLCAYRKDQKFQYLGHNKNSVSEIEVSYVLPPLQAGEAERLVPVLNAVAGIIDNRAEQGMDPSYTPSAPKGTPGENVWSLTRAGISWAEVIKVSFGAYQPTDKLYFPAVVLTLQLKEISQPDPGDFGNWGGNDVAIDLTHPPDAPVDDFVDFEANGT